MIKLYGTAMCSRCKTAKLMLEHRGLKEGVDYEYKDVSLDDKHEIPYLEIEGKIFEGKEALLEIRRLKNEA